MRQDATGSPLRPARRLLAALLATGLAACSTIGDDFVLANARRVQNGMTREEVIAIMGSEPSTVEGSDHGKLIWLYALADPLTIDRKRVSFSFDEYGKVYGIPREGVLGGSAGEHF